MSEYPKVIDVDGLKYTVADAADEAKWRGQAPTPVEPASIPDLVPEPLTEPEPVEDEPDTEPEPEEEPPSSEKKARLVKHPVTHKGAKKK